MLHYLPMVSRAKVLRFSDIENYYGSTSTGSNIHRRSSNSITDVSDSWVNFAGCLLVGKSGIVSSSEYAKFIQTIGIVKSNLTTDVKYKAKVSGKVGVDSTYAEDYPSSVGYPEDAIDELG